MTCHPVFGDEHQLRSVQDSKRHSNGFAEPSDRQKDEVRGKIKECVFG